jgi:methylated-DNA-[protein]-cysteine S-methyltransferase
MTLPPTNRPTIGRIETPLGVFGAALTPHGLARLTFPHEPFEECAAWTRHWMPGAAIDDRSDALAELARQLDDYFAGRLRVFTLPLDLRGTPFQVRVWRAVATIPYGEVRSYAQIAAATGNSRAVRAVGLANGANPVPIVVPCHRVVGSDGTLTGYAGGLALKRRLLALEGAAGFHVTTHEQAALPL